LTKSFFEKNQKGPPPERFVGSSERGKMDSNPDLPNQLNVSHDELAAKLAEELINPLYCPETRRTQSAVKEEYIPFLDSWFDPGYSRKTYPMNSRGSLARIDSQAVEFFVNIPSLDDAVRDQARNPLLLCYLIRIDEPAYNFRCRV